MVKEDGGSPVLFLIDAERGKPSKKSEVGGLGNTPVKVFRLMRQKGIENGPSKVESRLLESPKEWLSLWTPREL